MSHMWDRGVLNQSSWHKLEEIGQFTDAASMIAHGLRSNAWPTAVHTLSPVVRFDGCIIPTERYQAVLATYQSEVARVVGINGSDYEPTSVESRDELVNAAVAAGAQPTGAFSLDDGRKWIATFQVNGADNGIVTNLLISDSFDGSSKLTVGTTSIRVVCANTLALSMQADGANMAKLRHGTTLNQKVTILSAAIGKSLESGKSMREAFQRATEMRLDRVQAQRIFDQLFPEAPEDAAPGIKTRADNFRDEARKAMALDVNMLGNTLATLWNAATYLVDRRGDGSARTMRSGGDPLMSMLFGKRGSRVGEISQVINQALAA